MELLLIGHDALKVTLTREDMEEYDIDFDMLDYSNTETRRIIFNILDKAKRSLGFEAEHESLYIQAFRSRCGGCELFVTRSENSNRLFKFKDSDSLIKCCARLKNCGFNKKSRAYISDSDEFFLEICDSTEYIFIDEIGLRLPYSKSYLCEHTTPLCDNAVEVMAGLR